MQQQPIFILGNPRSGTTLLRVMLTSHPDICIPPECGFLQWLYPEYGDWNAPDSDNLERSGQFVQALLQTRKFETWELGEEELLAAIPEFKPSDYAALVAVVYQQYAIRKGKDGAIWGDKNNYYVAHVPLLTALFPKARFIHIVRDVRDIICSYLELGKKSIAGPYRPNLSSEPVQIASEWKQNISRVQDGLKEHSISKYQVRYENLVIHTEDTLRELCAYLDIEFSLDMLQFNSKVKEEALEPAGFLQWKERITQPVDPSRIARYKAELDGQTIELISKTCAAELATFGYAK